MHVCVRNSFIFSVEKLHSISLSLCHWLRAVILYSFLYAEYFIHLYLVIEILSNLFQVYSYHPFLITFNVKT